MPQPAAKKSLGQHWLDDHASLQAMVDAAQLSAGATVLEIGPGYGTLTEYLLAAGAEVAALEFDDRLVPGLLKKFAQVPELSVEQGDIRRYDFGQLPPDYTVVANIPYYLTSNLIQLLSETVNPPQTAVLLIQKEVAQRATAQPGNMSILSVTTQYYWQGSLGQLVPARLFTPPPKVDSQILILKRQQQPLFTDITAKQFFRVVKAGFSQKRKTLLNSLSGGLSITRPAASELLHAAAIDPSSRAQTLSIADWHRLAVLHTDAG